MTTTNTTNRGSISSPVLAGTYPLAADFMSASELQVWEITDATGVERLLVSGVDYTFALAGTPPSTGTLTAFLAYADTTWRWRRNTTLDQQTDLTALGTFPADSIERAFDKAILAVQDTNDIASRSLRGPAWDPQDLTLPDSSARASKALHFDSAGLPSLVTPADASGTLVTTAGGTARSLITRFEEVINVKDYGAAGDGTTDDTAAINLAFAALRAEFLITDGVEESYPGTVLFPPGRYKISAAIDATMIWGYGWKIEGTGAQIESSASGAAMLDLFGSRFGEINGLTFYGDDTTVPAWGIIMGRESSLSPFRSTGDFVLNRVTFFGYFSKGCLYNFAAESVTYNSCVFWNRHSSASSYAIVLDARYQTAFGVASVTEEIPPDYDQLESFNTNVFNQCDFRKMVSGPTIYICNGSGFRFHGCYGVSYDDAVVVVVTGGGYPINDLYLDMHFEVQAATACVRFEGILGDVNMSVHNLYMRDLWALTTGTILLAGASISGTVELRDYDLAFSYNAGGTKLIDPPARFALQGGRVSAPNIARETTASAENGYRNTVDRNLDGYNVGTQLIFDKVQGDAAFKGKVKFFDGNAAVAVGALGNTGFSALSGSGLTLKDGITAPGTVAGEATIYIDTADGDLKVKFGDGFVRVIAADS